MAYGSSAAQYLEADILSRPKEWLVPLVYEHIAANLTRARVQIEQRDYEGKARSLQKASELVHELIVTLDREQGGDLAERLVALYTFLAAEIITVGRSLDIAYLQRLIAMVTDLHEAWVQAAEQVAPRARAGSLAATTA